MSTPEIVEKPAFRVVGLEAPFIGVLSPDATASEVIGPLWGRFLERIEEIEHRTGEESYGVMYWRPPDERSHPDEGQYIAGAAVDAAAQVPEGMVSYDVPKATFGVFTHAGPIGKIGDTIRHVMEVWLPTSGFQLSGIDVELYDHRFSQDDDASEMEYWISVVPSND